MIYIFKYQRIALLGALPARMKLYAGGPVSRSHGAGWRENFLRDRQLLTLYPISDFIQP